MGRALSDRLSNLWWEVRLGVSTRGVVPVDVADSHCCATAEYSLIEMALTFLGLTDSDTFVDVGCGKGRVVCMAARYPVRAVIGVDLSAEFCAMARANADRMRGRRAPVTIETCWAQRYDYSAATALYLFDPFGPDTLSAVLGKVAEDTRGNAVRIAYVNPTYAAVFDGQPWLERYELWPKADTGLEHSVAFYRTGM
ncbi:MAG TPA: class I SAM-dependent methyltransferase [Micromonosporaceae bacterium]|nr:class I SAM-dependent methyltransferase [Micromonosporaceae bacterium]